MNDLDKVRLAKQKLLEEYPNASVGITKNVNGYCLKVNLQYHPEQFFEWGTCYGIPIVVEYVGQIRKGNENDELGESN